MGENWSGVAAEAFERTVTWRDHVLGNSRLPEPDLVAITGALISVMSDDELSETLRRIADRLSTGELPARGRASVMNFLKRGIVPTRPPYISRHDD